MESWELIGERGLEKIVETVEKRGEDLKKRNDWAKPKNDGGVEPVFNALGSAFWAGFGPL